MNYTVSVFLGIYTFPLSNYWGQFFIDLLTIYYFISNQEDMLKVYTFFDILHILHVNTERINPEFEEPILD